MTTTADIATPAAKSNRPGWRRRLAPGTFAPWLWLLPTLTLLIPFFLIPLAIVVRYSFNRDDPLALMVSDFTLQNYVRILTDEYYFALFTNTISVSFIVAVICLLLGYPFAYFLVRYSHRSRGFLIWAVYTPLIVSVIVRVFGWIVVTSDSGLINAALLALGRDHRTAAHHVRGRGHDARHGASLPADDGAAADQRHRQGRQ
jgi:putative spermidine/putrescine transport system permease protein